MARSRRARGKRTRESDGDDFVRFLAGWKRTEARRGAEWHVQPVAAARSEKSYTCPGCSRTIPAGTAHLVTWRADGIMGDAAALAERRHWHRSCWEKS